MKLFKKIKEFAKNQKVLYWAFLIMLILPNVFMFFTESTGVLTRIVQILLPFSLYWIAMTLKDKPGKMFWILFLFIFIDAFQIVLLYLFGESPIAVDMFLNVVTTNVSEADELLMNLLPAVGFVFVIYVGGIVLSIVSLRNKEKLIKPFRTFHRKMATVLFVISLILLGVNFAVDKKFKFQDDVFPFNGCYNLGLSVQRFCKSMNYLDDAQKFSYNAKSERADSIPEVYVLVIGETVRACNLGVYGYKKNTTPHLSEMKSNGEALVYRDAITMSNTTHKSVPLILTAAASEEFDSLYTQRGIFTAFNEAGYKTCFLSNQGRNHSFIDNLGGEAQDVEFAMDTVKIGHNVNDKVLLKMFEKRIKQYKGGKMFIVLHCYGSHFNYADRYPAEDRRFSPDDVPSANKDYRPSIENAYDNTISFIDKILYEITRSLEALNVPSVMLFTSDHGEDIFDDSRNRFLHASPLPTFYQLRVPYVIWGSKEYREQYAQKWSALKSNVEQPISTNLITFHTLLDVAGVKAKLYNPEYALGSGVFKSTRRMYVNDHNEFHTIDDAGLKDLDVEQFKKNNMRYP